MHHGQHFDGTMSLDLQIYLSQFDDNLSEFLRTRPSKHYKAYKIPKRKVGFRIIAQPTPRVKGLQRNLVKYLSTVLDVHDAAYGYRVGRGIKQNAQKHVDSEYLLKMDVSNFFNSLNPKVFFDAIRFQNIRLSKQDREILQEICFWNRTKRNTGKLVLSVGAPSSPFISNTIMYSFDEQVSRYCEEIGVTYTRYADDLTFSSKEKGLLQKVRDQVVRDLENLYNGVLVINEAKTIFSSKGNNRHVTGVVLSNNNRLSLGRDRKRYMSALVHKFKFNRLDVIDSKMLQGWLSHARYIEPNFYKRLEAKYGKNTLDKISSFNIGVEDESGT